MATVYRAPTRLGDPPDFIDFKTSDGRYDFAAHAEAEQAWIDSVAAAAREANPNCDIAGERVQFQIADGYAVYIVWNGSSIVHCPVGDAWTIPDAHARGLRASDLRELVRSRKALDDLFSKKATS